MAENDVKKDDSIDLSGMIQMSKSGFANQVEASVETPTEEKSPIEQAEEAAMKHDTGIEVEEESNEPEMLRSTFDSDERRAEFEKKKTEMDSTIEKTKRVVVVKKPTNEAETARMMDEIEATIVRDDGSVIVPEDAKFIVPKTPEIEQAIAEEKAAKESGEEQASKPDSEKTPEEIAREAKGALVKVLIDKTGLGANIDFTEEEKKILATANEIHLVEIEDQEIATAEYDRPDDDEDMSFMQMVDEYQLSTSKVPMIFPASGFKADMVGLPWGDFAAITLDVSDESTDYLNFDKLYRKFSVIYTYMKNISIGPFESLEDFLKHFAFTDVQFATYGLAIATQPEDDALSLRCNAEDCGKPFTYHYSPRSIIDFSTASKSMLEDIDRVADVKPEERMKLYKNSRVNKFKVFKIPNTDIIFELGNASCWDYLYGFVSLINQYQKDDLLDDDPRWELTPMLMGLRAIRLKTKDGKVKRFTKPSKLIEILLHLRTEDVAIIKAAYEQYISQYYISFKLTDIVCPHCGHKTAEIPITPDELVFQIYSRQRNTGWQFDNFRDF